MRVKKYRAASLPEALRAVKRDLGPDAVIVHSRRVPRAGVLGMLGQDAVEVVAAVESAPPPPTPSPTLGGGAYPGRPAPDSDGETAEDGWGRRPHPDPLPEGEGPTAGIRPLESGTLPSPKTPPPFVGEGGGGGGRLLQEITDLKDELARFRRQAEGAAVYKLAPGLVALYRGLLRQEVEPEVAQALVTAVDRELSDEALADPRAIDDSLRRHLQRLVPVTGPLQPRPPGPLVVMLVGPTGVGKTTTLAKLAATYALERRRVSLVTTDTFRVAAIPQLQTYAEILGLPIAVAYTPADLGRLVADAAESRKGPEVILVDTPGRSQHHDRRLAELRAFAQAAPGATALLTVSASTRERDLRDIVARFGVVPFAGLLVTKLDETATFGPVVNLVHASGKPLTYLTTGQNVPADIEVATSERIAWLIAEDTHG